MVDVCTERMHVRPPTVGPHAAGPSTRDGWRAPGLLKSNSEAVGACLVERRLLVARRLLESSVVPPEDPG